MATTDLSTMSARISNGLLIFLCLVTYCYCLKRSLFSTKTAYKLAHPEPEGGYKDDDLNGLPEFEGKACSALHTSMVIRHGTRFPGLEDVHDIIALHEKLVDEMEPDENPELYNWKNQFPSNNNKALTHIGEEELEGLAKRVSKRLSTLFSDEDISSFRFITSSQERTKQSASAFFEGFVSSILSEDEDALDDFDSEVSDELMRFFDLCARYVYDVKDNKTAMKEFYTFMNGDKIDAIKNSIIKKLDVKAVNMTNSQVRLIYLICGYEKAVYGHSPWCPLLDEEDLVSLEYLNDIKHYYKNGYGFNITWQQSCKLVAEIFFSMDEVILEIENTEEDEEEEGYVVGQFAFGHAETLGPLYTALGLFNDSLPLRADNFDDQEHRKFRTSDILPFGANIMFILYDCVPEEFGEEEEVEEAEYYVKVLVNESPVIIPGCEKEYCDYHVLKKIFSSLIDEPERHFAKKCKRKMPKDEL